MNAIALPRMNLVPVPSIPNIEDMAKTVRNAIGYGGLQNAVENYRLQVKDALFANELIEKGYAPFEMSAVSKYKFREELKANKWGVTLAVLAVLLLPASIAAGFIISEFFVFCLLGAVPLIAIASNTTSYEWCTDRIRDYDSPIPIEVLNTAMELKREFPAAGLYVESLMAKEKVRDPFLIIKQYEKSYYIAVWDEPGFNL